jgi:hypothetical protein
MAGGMTLSPGCYTRLATAAMVVAWGILNLGSRAVRGQDCMTSQNPSFTHYGTAAGKNAIGPR